MPQDFDMSLLNFSASQSVVYSDIIHNVPKLEGNSFSFVSYESNMADVNINTWWIDSGSTIHITNSLHGMQDLRKPVGSE
jgi:hypothetical protein